MDTNDDANHAIGDTEHLISKENGQQQDNDAIDIAKEPDSASVDVPNSNAYGTFVENRKLANNCVSDDPQAQAIEAVNGTEGDSIVRDQIPEGIDDVHQIQNADSEGKSFRRQFGIASSTIFMTLMTSVGPRIVIIPIAISNGGLMLGTAGVFILAVISIHCSHLIVITSDKLNNKRSYSTFDYFETIKKAFLKGPTSLRRFARCMSISAHVSSYLAEFGFCIEAFLFMAGSLHEIIANLHGSPASERGLIFFLLPFVLSLSFIEKLSIYGVLTKMSNLGAIIAIIITYSYCIPGPYSTSVIPYVAPLHRLPYYFGCIMYIFEGMIMHLPLRGAMAYPEDFLGPTGVFTTGKMFAYVVYGGLGFFGYLKYGENTRSSLSFNLPKTAWGETARILYVIYMLVGFSLQLYILVSFCTWPAIRKKFQLYGLSDRRNKGIEIGLRLLFISTTSAIALFIPDIDLLIILIGSLGVGPLVLIFPPLIDIITIWNSEIKKRKLILTCLKDALILLFGVVACSVGTYVAFKDIINGFSDMSNITF